MIIWPKYYVLDADGNEKSAETFQEARKIGKQCAKETSACVYMRIAEVTKNEAEDYARYMDQTLEDTGIVYVSLEESGSDD